MTQRIKFLVVSAVLGLSTSAFAGEWIIDGSHSNALFKIRHLVSKVNGEFKNIEGKFSFDPAKMEEAKGSFSIKAASINTNNEKRDGHLRSPDFFDTEKFPTLSFESKKVQKAGKNKFKLSGDLTMHGVTKPVTFEAEFLGTEKDPWGTTKAGFVASAKVNRKDFGIIWNKTLDSGSIMLGDEVEVQINIEADAPKAEAAKS